MSDPAPPPPEPLPEAQIHARRPFHVVWLIPIVAAVIAGFLGWRAISQQGATITITFSTAEGLVAGQTKIRHKAVDLGTVRRINLAPDMSHVIVEADMRRQADRYLTAHAKFWVVRPRLRVGNISGLDTLLSGSYIEMDPGLPSGPSKTAYTGLEEPPAIRSDEPGRSFVLTAARIGSLSSGSPVFYRDIVVGEVLGYELPPIAQLETGHIRLNIFIRSPYDQLVHEGSYFWNASGVSVQLGAEGVRLQLESLQALLSGGIAFDTPSGPRAGPAGAAEASFPLYQDQAAAIAAGFRDRIPFVAYLRGSVRGLAVGAPVELFGIQIGSVTGVRLELDPSGQSSRVAVNFQVQPERIFGPGYVAKEPPLAITRHLVAQGLRVQLRSANLLTGQLYVALDFFPGEKPAEVVAENGTIVIPTLPGGLEGITASVGQILDRVRALPLEDISRHLDAALAGLDSVANGPELKQSLRELSGALAAVDELVRQANAGIKPAMERLPQIAQNLQTATDRAARLLGSAEAGYGGNSQVRRDLERLMDQASDALRSVRLLADFLDQHPEALVRGRTGAGGAP